MSINHRYVPGGTEHLTEAPRHLLETRVRAIQSELEQRGKTNSKPRGNRYWTRIENELQYINHELSMRAADDEIIKQLEKTLAEA